MKPEKKQNGCVSKLIENSKLALNPRLAVLSIYNLIIFKNCNLWNNYSSNSVVPFIFKKKSAVSATIPVKSLA